MALPPLRIGDLQAPIPIVQGGMGIGISLSNLASAVANAGGVGVVASAGIGFGEPDFMKNFTEANSRALRDQIRQTKSKTNGVWGVNVMCASTNYAEIIDVCVEEEVPIIFSGAGLPLQLPKYVGKHRKSPKLAPIVSSGRAASLIARSWKRKHGVLPDAVVVEGPMAGGHLGYKPEQLDDVEFALEKTLPDVIEAMKPFAKERGEPIPVIAAGGIYTGADIKKYLDMGAAAVQMGTRFVATHECDANIKFKEAYVNAKEEDLVIVKSPVGLPGRALRNAFVNDVEQGQKKPFSCRYHCLNGCKHKESPYCIALALIAAREGEVVNGLAFAGRNAWRVDRIQSVAELMTSLVSEYETSTMLN